MVAVTCWEGETGVLELGRSRNRIVRVKNPCGRVWTYSCCVLLRVQLANTEEYIDGALSGNLGEVLIR